jgi:nudix-type nucleoside diphosphatase (YffH/AdpP family)
MVPQAKERRVSEHRISETTVLHKGWGKLLSLKITLPDGRTMTREVQDHGSAIAVLPYDPVRRSAILVRQFRAAVFYAAQRPHLLEALAGMLDGEDPETCARREAEEEVGLRLGALEPIGAFWPLPGISTERQHLFLAPCSRSDRIGEGGGLAEEHEDITVIEMPLVELARMADAGEILDLKTLALVQTLRLRRPELFSPGGDRRSPENVDADPHAEHFDR